MASLASAFPSLTHHMLALSLIGLGLITAVNLWDIAESARVLILPIMVLLCVIFGVIVCDMLRHQRGTRNGLIPKAFAAGCRP
ncbi:hypothetical protein ACIOC2_36015 [Streptomyces sp. NPDC088337]|uniref:hypothetical protein n=1 Tax=unclassified Streptomyces TaxID=2593676 RepID=UPI003806C7BC